MTEKFSEGSTESSIEKSPLREAYLLLNAKTPLELFLNYTKEEQVLFINKTWDYENPEQIQNIVKNILESVDVSTLNDDEKFWRDNILWFWYHHAISVAGWMKDKEKQKQFSEIAVSFGEEHTNLLTKIMYLLTHDRLKEAEELTILNQDDPDNETAVEMLENYKAYGALWPDIKPES